MEQHEEEQSPFSQEEQPGSEAPQPEQPADEAAPAQPEESAESAETGEPGEPAAESDSEFQDKVIVCVDCSAEFVHTASAQAFYKEKGFANEPKRCAACRKARKGQSGYTARGGAPRQMYPAVCAACNKETQVPFQPSGARPVYCLDCYRKQRGG